MGPHAKDQSLGVVFGHLDLEIEIAVILEGIAVQQLELWLIASATAIFFD
jgi:hypothetical protein